MKTVLSIAVWACFPVLVYAQFTVQHQPPVYSVRNSTAELQFIVSGLSVNDVQSSRLFYRYDGEFAYQQKEVTFQNGIFTALIPVDDPNASRFEYYFELVTLSGERYTYPANDPEEVPAGTQIRDVKQEEIKKFDLIDFTILSPMPGSGVAGNDVLVSVAFFYEKEKLPKGKIKLYIDDVDVTALADTGAYYFSYIPDYLKPGPHHALLTYKTAADEMHITKWQFFVIPEGSSAYNQTGLAENYVPSGMAELEARNQIIGGDENNAYTGRTRFSGSYKKLQYTFNTYLTSQESNRLQPQNRYGLNMQYGDWWNFEAGHVFPRMSRFTISGRRIYGINTSLHLLKRSMNFQFLYGELDRNISNRYGNIIPQTITASDGAIVDTTYSLSLEDRGTFSRNVVGGRIGIGNEEKFQIGVQLLKVRDDSTSLFNVLDYNDISGTGSELALGSSLSQNDRIKLQQNPQLLSVQGGSVRPKDNLVVGSDLRFSLFDNRVRFESEAVISALNNDIYKGPLTTARAEELGFDIDTKTTDLLERLAWLIIVNENMHTLPIRIVDGADGETTAEVFFPTSILAGSSELSIRFPRNNLRLQYRWIGPDFNSLANSTIRKDVAGFTVSDRLNLLSNRLYITLGLEQLQDNVSGNRDATTKTNTYNTNISWYPIKRQLPRVSVGLRYRLRDNEVERFNPLIPTGFENAAVQNLYIHSNGDTLTAANPRLSNTININVSVSQQFEWMGMIHNASVNVANMNTKDEMFVYGDIVSSSVSFNLSTRFQEKPLVTQMGFLFNNTESGSGQSSVNIFGMFVGANYRMMENRFMLNGRMALTNNETASRALEIVDNNDNISENDYYILGAETSGPAFNTLVIQAGGQYNINETHSIILDANFTNVSGQSYSNDRIIQLRYVFRF